MLVKGFTAMNPLGAVFKGMDRASDVSSSAMNMGQITLLRHTYGLLNVSVYSLFPQGRAQQSILWVKTILTIVATIRKHFNVHKQDFNIQLNLKIAYI